MSIEKLTDRFGGISAARLLELHDYMQQVKKGEREFDLDTETIQRFLTILAQDAVLLRLCTGEGLLGCVEDGWPPTEENQGEILLSLEQSIENMGVVELDVIALGYPYKVRLSLYSWMSQLRTLAIWQAERPKNPEWTYEGNHEIRCVKKGTLIPPDMRVAEAIEKHGRSYCVSLPIGHGA